MVFLAITVLATITLYYELYVGGSVSTLILVNLHMTFTFYVVTMAFGALIGAFGSLLAGLGDRLAGPTWWCSGCCSPGWPWPSSSRPTASGHSPS